MTSRDTASGPDTGTQHLGVTGPREAVFRALTERAPVGVYVLNARGECEYANERVCELAGLRLDQMLGTGWKTALHPDDAEGVLQEWARVTAGEHGYAREHRFLHRDGRVTWVEVVGSPVHDVDGTLL